MQDPFSAPAFSFLNPYANGAGMVQREPPQPKLLPADVRGLRSMLDDMLRHQPMTEAQRANVAAIRDRLAAVQKDLPPSIPLAVATWLRSFDDGDHDAIIARGNDLLKACGLGGEPVATVETLMKAMTEISARLVASQMAGLDAGAPTEAGDASAIEWHEPADARFYCLSGAAGKMLAEMVEDLRHVDRYIRRGARPPTRAMFTGGPGSGKTTGAIWVAAQLDKPAAILRLVGLRSKFIGTTARNIQACLDAAEKRDAVVVMDEVDAVTTRRDADGYSTSEEDKKTTDAVLQMLESRPQRQIIIGCTNVPHMVDPAAVRRFRMQIDFGTPDLAARIAMLTAWWATALHDADARDVLLARSEGKSGDYLERAAEYANRAAARRDGPDDAARVAAGEEPLGDVITVADVVAALAASPPEVALRTGHEANGGAIVRPSETDMGRVLLGGRRA